MKLDVYLSVITVVYIVWTTSKYCSNHRIGHLVGGFICYLLYDCNDDHKSGNTNSAKLMWPAGSVRETIYLGETHGDDDSIDMQFQLPYRALYCAIVVKRITFRWNTFGSRPLSGIKDLKPNISHKNWTPLPKCNAHSRFTPFIYSTAIPWWKISHPSTLASNKHATFSPNHYSNILLFILKTYVVY